MNDPVRRHARLVLRAPFLADDARRLRAGELARAGRPVVEGGMRSATGWELRDWLTGNVVAAGQDGPAGLRAALARTYPADRLYAEVQGPEPVTAGVPPSLSRAIEEWVCDPHTPDEDIASFVGWPVGRVREHR